MSLFLPDPNGQFKVRIWQDFWYEPAGIDYVGLTHDGTNANMTSAFDLRKNTDVTNLLNSSDGIRDDWGWSSSDPTGYPYSRARNRWVEVTFNVQGQQNFPPTTNPVAVTDLTNNAPTISWTYQDQNGDPQAMYEVEVWSASGGSGSNMWDPAVRTGTATSIVYAGFR